MVRDVGGEGHYRQPRRRMQMPRSCGDVSSEQCDGFQSRFTLASSMTRVFTTSKGVVAAAAMPPATDPHRAASYEVGRLPPR